MHRRYFLLIAVICGVWMACSKDENEPERDVTPQTVPLNIDVNLMPYPTLSEYNLYTGSNMADLVPNEGLLLYEPTTPLFTDYAKKTRYVWMPDGVSANYESDFSSLNFPDGAVLIKNFFYENSVMSFDFLWGIIHVIVNCHC